MQVRLLKETPYVWNIVKTQVVTKKQVSLQALRIRVKNEARLIQWNKKSWKIARILAVTKNTSNTASSNKVRKEIQQDYQKQTC